MKLALSLLMSIIFTFAPLGILRGAEAINAEDISAEQLAGFYPSSMEQSALSAPAYSHIVIQGFQKASTTRLYDFGSVEITYYSPEDKVFDKKVAKLRLDRVTVKKLEQQGFPVVVVERKRDDKPVKIMADVGGEIAVVVDCSSCETRDDLMAKMAAFDLKKIAKLLESPGQ